VEPNVSVLWTAWKLRGGAATCYDGRRRGMVRGGKEERERDTDQQGRKTGEKGNTLYFI